MSTLAHDAVNIPKTSTGPKTEARKAASSPNAPGAGLKSPAHDFIRPGEEEEYAQTLIQLMDELAPEGILEQTYATEIMGATWRLRRCRMVEEAFSLENSDLDPMLDERTEKQQKSVDRARAQSHLILRRSLAELRNLRKARGIPAAPSGRKPTPRPPVKEWEVTWVSRNAAPPPNATGKTASVCFVTLPRPPLPPAVRFVKDRNSPPAAPAAAVPEQKLSAAAGTNAPPVLNRAA